MTDDVTRALVLELEDQRYRAMLEGDLDTLDRLLSSALNYVHSNAERDTKASYLQKVRDGVFIYDAIEHPVDRVELIGDVALVIGRMHARAQLAGRPIQINNSALAVWGRAAGMWTLLAYQPTPLEKT